MIGRSRWVRCLLVWLLASLALGAVAGLALPTARPSVTGPFDQLVVRLASVALLACAGWGWIVATLVVAGVLRGATSRVPAPAVVRRLLLSACGAALSTGLATGAVGGGVAPALADGPSLAGLPFPDRAVATAHPHPATIVTVRPGDTLWSLAADHLRAGADDREIADACRHLYQLNRAAIGDDPDLIEPGLRLAVPEGGAS